MVRQSKRVFILQPFTSEFDEAHQLIRAAAEAAGVETSRLDQVAVPGSITEQLYEAIETSDLIICDITHSNPNVMYELGYTHGLRKPVILISRRFEYMPFDVRSVRTLLYDPDFGGQAEFVRNLELKIQEALRNPELFSARPKTETAVNTVFISYSHEDIKFLDRLRVHMRPLEKLGLMDLWDDWKIDAGDLWQAAIEEALGRARVAILLVSADFLASDFIVENELPPLLAKAESDGTRIVPIIVKPCRFLRDKNLSRFQAINDPATPLINMSEGDQEKVYDQLSQLVERHMGGAKSVV
jgi:hypothetical protein